MKTLLPLPFGPVRNTQRRSVSGVALLLSSNTASLGTTPVLVSVSSSGCLAPRSSSRVPDGSKHGRVHAPSTAVMASAVRASNTEVLSETAASTGAMAAIRCATFCSTSFSASTSAVCTSPNLLSQRRQLLVLKYAALNVLKRGSALNCPSSTVCSSSLSPSANGTAVRKPICGE